MNSQDKLRHSLRAYFDSARLRNPEFSLRSLARHLDISAGNLSQFLNEKRNFSSDTVEEIVRKITDNPEERKDLLEEINKLQLAELRKEKIAPATTSDYEFVTISEEEFERLDEWYYFAVRTILGLRNPRFDVEWIAAKLGITIREADKSLKLLFEMKLIALSPTGAIVRTKKHLKTPDSINKKHKIHELKTKIHVQHLEQAIHSVKVHDPSRRDVTWVNIPANPKKLDQAREIIRKCQDDLLALLEDENAEELYRLTIQLCPLGK